MILELDLLNAFLYRTGPQRRAWCNRQTLTEPLDAASSGPPAGVEEPDQLTVARRWRERTTRLQLALDLAQR